MFDTSVIGSRSRNGWAFVLAIFALAAVLLSMGCSKKVVVSSPAEPGSAPRTVRTAPAPQTKGQAIARTALSQMGAPYKWGGTSPRDGFDCSGLVWWAHHRHGVTLPRPSWKQIRVGRPVDPSRLQPGDLVFYKITSKGPSYHVGIVTDGDFFVHSPSRGKHVREDALFGTYWRERFVAARRVVD